jgi:3-oxoacyl-[acyl-carrier-protein] synthase-3
VQTNEELCATTLTSTTPEWILAKTGIQRRYLASSSESASSLILTAAQGALAAARISPKDLGLIVVCTFSGDYLFPPASAKLHLDLGAKGAHIFDIQANCAGFVTGLTVASDRMSRDERLRYALVVGAEVLSPFTDGSDVETAVYFSDGAGAAVIGRVGEGKGVQASAFFTDTQNYEAVRLRGGGSSFPYVRAAADPGLAARGYMNMNGLATWKQVVTHLPPTVARACALSGIVVADVDHFVFHQANMNLIQYAMQKLRVPVERAFINVHEVGNTGAASLPLALSHLVQSGRVECGQTVVLAGVGAGFNFGASVWIWDDALAATR